MISLETGELSNWSSSQTLLISHSTTHNIVQCYLSLLNRTCKTTSLKNKFKKNFKLCGKLTICLQTCYVSAQQLCGSVLALRQAEWSVAISVINQGVERQHISEAVFACCLCMTVYMSLCFRGVGPGCNTREIADKLINLKAELDDLALRENELDQQRVWVQQSIKNVTDDSNNSPYPLLHIVSDLSPGQCWCNIFNRWLIYSLRFYVRDAECSYNIFS